MAPRLQTSFKKVLGIYSPKLKSFLLDVIKLDCSVVDNFHLLSNKVLFGTTVDDDEPNKCDVIQNIEQCMRRH